MADAAPDVAAPLFAVLAPDPRAVHLGIAPEQVRPGYARAAMTVGPELLNAVGTAHGGATMALLDVVHAAVSNSHGTAAVAQDVHTEFLEPGRSGDRLVAEGVEVHRSSRTAVYRIEARAQDGRLVATALARCSAPTARGPRPRSPHDRHVCAHHACAHHACAAGRGRGPWPARRVAGRR